MYYLSYVERQDPKHLTQFGIPLGHSALIITKQDSPNSPPIIIAEIGFGISRNTVITPLFKNATNLSAKQIENVHSAVRSNKGHLYYDDNISRAQYSSSAVLRHKTFPISELELQKVFAIINRDKKIKTQRAELFLMSPNEKIKDSDPDNLYLYHEKGNLTYYVQGKSYTIDEKEFKKEEKESILKMFNQGKFGKFAFKDKVESSEEKAGKSLLELTSPGYSLALMSDKKLEEKNIIEIKCTNNGLEYRVIGLNKIEVSSIIPWKDLPPNLPQNDKEILAQKNEILPKLLNITSQAGHTLAAKGHTKKSEAETFQHSMTGFNCKFYALSVLKEIGIVEANALTNFWIQIPGSMNDKLDLLTKDDFTCPKKDELAKQIKTVMSLFDQHIQQFENEIKDDKNKNLMDFKDFLELIKQMKELSSELRNKTQKIAIGDDYTNIYSKFIDCLNQFVRSKKSENKISKISALAPSTMRDKILKLIENIDKDIQTPFKEIKTKMDEVIKLNIRGQLLFNWSKLPRISERASIQALSEEDKKTLTTQILREETNQGLKVMVELIDNEKAGSKNESYRKDLDNLKNLVVDSQNELIKINDEFKQNFELINKQERDFTKTYNDDNDESKKMYSAKFDKLKTEYNKTKNEIIANNLEPFYQEYNKFNSALEEAKKAYEDAQETDYKQLKRKSKESYQACQKQLHKFIDNAILKLTDEHNAQIKNSNLSDEQKKKLEEKFKEKLELIEKLKNEGPLESRTIKFLTNEGLKKYNQCVKTFEENQLKIRNTIAPEQDKLKEKYTKNMEQCKQNKLSLLDQNQKSIQGVIIKLENEKLKTFQPANKKTFFLIQLFIDLIAYFKKDYFGHGYAMSNPLKHAINKIHVTEKKYGIFQDNKNSSESLNLPIPNNAPRKKKKYS